MTKISEVLYYALNNRNVLVQISPPQSAQLICLLLYSYLIIEFVNKSVKNPEYFKIRFTYESEILDKLYMCPVLFRVPKPEKLKNKLLFLA